MNYEDKSKSKLAVAFYIIGGLLLLYVLYTQLFALYLLSGVEVSLLSALFSIGFFLQLVQPIAIILMGKLAQQVHDVRQLVLSGEADA